MPNALRVRSAPHAVLHFRDIKNACHGNITTRRTPGTLYECRAACGPAHSYLVGARRYTDLTFSPSHLLGSLLSRNAKRATPNGCGCGSSWLQARWVVQHSAHTSKTRNQDQNSFRATRHAPNAQHNVMQHDRCSCGYALLTLSLLSYSPPSLLVPCSKRPFKAVRSMRTTLYRVCYAWNEGGSQLAHALHRLRTPLMECRADLGQGGDASRVHSSPTLCTLLISSLASWVRNKYTAPIKIHFVPSVLAPFVAVVVQPHTTKSLTGGVLRTLLLGLYTDRSLVSFVKVVVMAVAAPKLSSVSVPADDETTVRIVLVMQPLLLTVPQVAQVLNMGRSKVYELITVGDLPVLRFGKSVRVRVSALERWLDLQEEKANPSQLRKVA